MAFGWFGFNRVNNTSVQPNSIHLLNGDRILPKNKMLKFKTQPNPYQMAWSIDLLKCPPLNM